MALLPPDQLLHLGPDPSSTVGWNHFDLGQGLATHINYPQSKLSQSPPQGAPWWYSKLNADGIPVVQFSAPLGGATTSTNTHYARDELREYERDGITKMAFDPKDGDHWIEGIYRVTGLGVDKRGVCVQQMHDPNDDVIMVRTENNGSGTGLYLNYNGTRVATLNSSFVIGQEFYLKTRVNNGTPSVYYTTNLASIPSTPTHTASGYFSSAGSGWYSKSGCYNQSNELTDPTLDPDASIIKVEVRELKHWHSKTPMGGAWPTPASYCTTPTGPTAPVVSAGADASILPSGTFSRTGSVTLNGNTLTSQSWRVLSGPGGTGTILSNTASVNWTPSTGTTTSTTGGQTLGVGGVATPAPASNVELNTSNRGSMNITVSGTALVPRIYDGGGFGCGRIDVNADYIVIQNYRINANSQYGAFLNGNNITFQNNDIKGISLSGDGDLNAITAFGNNISIMYNTAINFVSGSPGTSHTDFIQTWVSSSHPVASSGWKIIGNKATGPSNPSRDNSIASIHQCIMAEGLNRGGNSGGSGDPNNWLIADNEFGGSWNQEIKLDGVDNVDITRNKFVGSSDKILDVSTASSGVKYWSDNVVTGSYGGGVGFTTTSGSGPASPATGGGGTTTVTYPNGTYVLVFEAVTSAGTVSDTVDVIITNTPGGGGPVGTYPSFVSASAVASSDASGTVTVGAPGGVAPGHFQICVIQDTTSETITSVPSNWNLLDVQAVDNVDVTGQPGGPSTMFVYYNTTGDNQSRSWSKDGTRGFHAVRFAWKDYSGLGDHSSRGSSFTTTPYAPTVVPTIDSALVVTIMGSDRKDIGPGPVSVPTGWNTRYNAGVTVNTNEIEWISVADIQVTNRVATGANLPSGTGVGTSNFTLTNADNCSMFSLVLEGPLVSGTTTPATVNLNAGGNLSIGALGQRGAVSLIEDVTLTVRPIFRGNVALPIVAFLNPDARVYPRGTFIITATLTFATKLNFVGALQLTALGVLRAGSLPYRRPVLRTDYKYPPINHPFRLIAQRILDGEIVEWDLPVDNDFEYQVQLSGPIIMQGAFKPEHIQVQELALDGYAYWLHVEINQEIRASAIMLPPKYEESSMTFTAEGISAIPHYQYYDSTFSQIGVDAFSVVRTLWNYVQIQPQSDYGITLTQDNSGQTLGEAAWDELIYDPVTQEFHTDHHEAEPYELMWWDAVNIGEEIDKLSGQIPFDFLEHHKWNPTKTDVDHSIALGYPRLGQPRPNLMFDEENIIEVVPVQEGEDTYASAILIIGGGEGKDSIRSYAAHSYGDRVRKMVVITDKTINKRDRADALAQSELAARSGGRFEIAEIVINAYHANAPIGTYEVGDDIQVRVAIPWLMETQVAWYRITSITFKPSSDKIRLGLALSSTFVNSSETIPDPLNDYVPPVIPPAEPVIYAQYITLPIGASLDIGSTVAPAIIGGLSLIPTAILSAGGVVLRTGSVSMTVGKTLTAAGIATAPTSSTVTLISNKALTVGGTPVQLAATAMTVTATLATGAVVSKIGAVTLSATATISASLGTIVGAVTLTVSETLTATGTLTALAGFGSTLFGSTPFGSDLALGSINLVASKSLTVNARMTQFAAVALSVVKVITVGTGQNFTGAVGMTVSKTLVVGATGGGITTSQLGKQTDGTGSSLSSGDKTTVSKHTATTSGVVTAGHSRLWVDTGTANAEMVVYADNSGAVGGLLGQSDTVTISNTTEAQINFTFTGAQQAAITSGADYWIGFTWVDPGTNNVNWSRDTTTSSAQQNNVHAPDPFGTPTAVSGPIDAFVDITSGTTTPTTPVIRSVSTGGKSANADSSITCNKPAGLVASDYLLAFYGGDADSVLSALTASGFTTLDSQAADSTNNQPAGKVFGKVATSGDVAATNFTFGASTSGDAAVILAAIQTGTYSVITPVTVLGSWTTQARTSTMQQTAPSITGMNGGLLVDIFITDTNGVTESYPSSGPTGMTRLGTRQGVPSSPYVMVGAYYKALIASGATGTNSVSPTPSGITTNGWITTSLVVRPGSSGSSSVGMGFNWPNAIVTYVNQWDQQSTTYANRTKPFTFAQSRGAARMRTFIGTIDAVNGFKGLNSAATATQTWTRINEMYTDANTRGVKLIGSNYLTQETIQALAGTTYASWSAARAALVTPNSAAWNGLKAWIDALAANGILNHAGAYSWEVVNEPNYMLGVDDGSVTRAAAASFIDFFNAYYKTKGAPRTNLGGRFLYDQSQVTNAEITTLFANCDWNDDHCYPLSGTNAEFHIAALDTWSARVNSVTGRTVPMMVGEYGSNSDNIYGTTIDPNNTEFFTRMTDACVSRGWYPVTWGYDAWDIHIFNESTKLYVGTKIDAVNS
jgi:hypothetical protein